MQIVQKVSGLEHKIKYLQESFDKLKENYEDNNELKELYEKVVTHMMTPPIKVLDAITFGKYRKIAIKDEPKELLNFLKETGIKDKILGLSEHFISLVENMDDLKKVFYDLKMVPTRPIEIDPTWITVRRVDLNDRILNLFYESFIGSSYNELLYQVEKEEESLTKKKIGKKRGRKGKNKKGGDDAFTLNEIEEKKQEIKEISEEITDNMKYLVENKYSLQLKKMRKQKAITLEQEIQEELIKKLKLSKETVYY